MAAEDKYDEKTSVYSYGVVLYVLFNGKLPNQSMNDKLKTKSIKFPKLSPSISYDMSYENKNRPSFNDIIEIMQFISFELASEVDTESVFKRYQSLKSKKQVI